MWVIGDLFEFVIWPPVKKACVWYAGHLRRKQKWWHP